MKIMENKIRGYRSYCDKYDLDKAYAGKKDVYLGILLLYILVKDSGMVFESLSAEAEGELGSPHNILNTSDIGLFSSPENLSQIFKRRELRIWELRCKYEGERIDIFGHTYGSILSIGSPLTCDINFIPLMVAVENKTYDYHDYDPAIIEAFKNRFDMNQRATILTLIEMEKQKDIFDEFMRGMKEDPFIFPDTGAINVEGYTAQRLYNEHHLSELGAYNYLIYLRNDTKRAIEDLRNGLPRK